MQVYTVWDLRVRISRCWGLGLKSLVFPSKEEQGAPGGLLASWQETQVKVSVFVPYGTISVGRICQKQIP